MRQRAYVYELRRANEVIATGHLLQETALAIGDPISIGAHSGIVDGIVPIPGQNGQRLIVRLPPSPETVEGP